MGTGERCDACYYSYDLCETVMNCEAGKWRRRALAAEKEAAALRQERDEWAASAGRWCADCEAMREVVEAALAFEAANKKPWPATSTAERARLNAAIDAYRSGAWKR